MKRITIIALLLLTFIVGCKKKEETQSITVTSDYIKDIVYFLASDELEGRNTGSEGIEKSATFIETKFKDYGVKPYFDTYRDNFKIDSLDAFNVVGFLEGSDPKLKDEVVIIGAHYDHIGRRAKPVEGDSIGHGANDNASGTSTVIAMAKSFAAQKNNKRSIMFALFSGEEMGLRGAKQLAERLKNENLNLYTMVNFEMLGVPFPDRDYQVFATGYDLSNMAEVLNKYAGNKLVGKSDEAAKFNLFKRSDNYAFYEHFKIAAQTISSCDLTNFDFYHHVDDEADIMDYNHMASTINNLFPAMEGMINAPTQEIKMNDE